jgi:ABC-type transporter Mla MlaB component
MDVRRRRSQSVTVVLQRDGVELERWNVAIGARPDLRVVDALARLQLDARRRGCAIRVVGPTAALREVLELSGLHDLFGAP